MLTPRGNTRLFFICTAVASLLIVGFLRFYQLGNIPKGVTKDEAYYGYDAYSILHTGRDIWGKTLPLVFKSTGEYKLDLTYLMIPAIKLVGLNELALRLPSAVLGFATVIILFFTILRLSNAPWLAVTGASIFALSPWSFGMSRLFYESNAGLALVALGLYMVLNRRLSIAAGAFAGSAYLYSPYRYIGLGILIWSLILYGSKKWGRPLVLYSVLLLPLLIFSPSGAAGKRFAQEWALRKTSYEMTINDRRAQCYIEVQKNPLLTKMCYTIWNKPILYTSNVSTIFFEVISPEFLFFTSTNTYSVPKDHGMYLSYLLPFYVLGLIVLFGYGKILGFTTRDRLLLIGCITIAGVISSSPGVVEAYRYPVLLYCLFIIIMLGMRISWQWLQKQPRAWWSVCLAGVLALGIFQTVKYLTTYALYTQTEPLLFSSDVEEIFRYVEHKKDYTYIVDRKFFGPLTAAYFWQIDPTYFQQNIVWTDPDPWGFINAYRLGNIYAQTYDLDTLLCMKHRNPEVPLRAVIIDDPGKYPQWASYLTHDVSGSLALHAVYDIDELYPTILKYTPGDLCH